MTDSLDNRRPIAVRSTALARAAAGWLARAGVGPDAISLLGLGFALAAALALLAAPQLGFALYLVAAIFCPLRLVANLLDGMVAVEHGRGSALGPLFNEVPDRLSDVAVLVCAGYGAAAAPGIGAAGDLAIAAGWLAAVLAVSTAYLREAGRALGAPADFSGPFAKQQRMWAIIAAALLAFIVPSWAGVILVLALVVVVAGTAYTAYGRLMRLAAFLRREAAEVAREAQEDQRTSDSDGEGRTSSPRVM